MDEYGFWNSWFAVILAALGTFIWRFFGVLLASKIPAHSPMVEWVNTMAYAMVSGVLTLMLVYPIGILATSGLEDRLLGLAIGVIIMILTKRIITSLVFGILAFAATQHLF